LSPDETNRNENLRATRVRSLQLRPASYLIVALLVTAVGCGTGEYNRRMKDRVEELNSTVDIGAILYGAASPLADASRGQVGVTLQLPLLVTSQPATGDAAQPAFMKIPGFAYSYPVGSGGQSGNIYIAAVPVDKAAAELKSEIQGAVGGSFSGAAWAEAQVPTADGSGLMIQRISGTGQPGRFDLYLLTSSSHHVLVGWLAPDGWSEFFQASEYSMGSAMVSGG
jgi:hypothetical protein